MESGTRRGAEATVFHPKVWRGKGQAAGSPRPTCGTAEHGSSHIEEGAVLSTITDRETPDQPIGPFETAKESEILEVMRQVFISLRTSGLSRKDALLRLAHFEPCPRFPQHTGKSEETSALPSRFGYGFTFTAPNMGRGP